MIIKLGSNIAFEIQKTMFEVAGGKIYYSSIVKATGNRYYVVLFEI